MVPDIGLSERHKVVEEIGEVARVDGGAFYDIAGFVVILADHEGEIVIEGASGEEVAGERGREDAVDGRPELCEVSGGLVLSRRRCTTYHELAVWCSVNDIEVDLLELVF